MPKKPPPNGYYYFMLDFKKREESRGRRFHGGMQEVSTAASDDWKALTPAEKERYNRIAKERKNDPRPNAPKPDERRCNSQGVTFAQIKREKAEAEEKDKQEKSFVAKFVNDMTLDDLRDKLIYLIHVNIFCKTDLHVYYPAEMGIVKFSLKGGVKSVFHRYINPGEIATGYSFEVKDHSNRTHKLTLPFVSGIDGSRDFNRLYQDVIKFLTEDELIENSTPPLFTMYDDIFHNTSIVAVRKTLKILYEAMFPSQDEDRWERVFKVYPLPDMFYRLKNKCVALSMPESVAFPNTSLPKIELLKETYNYDSDTACKFHQGEDIIAHCSQAFVMRWAYIIRDHCTDYIGVDMFAENAVARVETNSGNYANRDDDDVSVVDSLLSDRFSEASISFANDGAVSKQGPSGLSKFEKNGKNDWDCVGSSTTVGKCNNSVKSAFVKREKKFDPYNIASSEVDEQESLFGDSSAANESIKSCPVAWPNVNRHPVCTVPVINEKNFPALGRGSKYNRTHVSVIRSAQMMRNRSDE